MITTLYFLQLIGFQLWYFTSRQVKLINPPGYLRSIHDNTVRYRTIGSVVIFLSAFFFIGVWGWMSGICASIVGLMGVGCLVIALYPFNLFKGKAILLLYALFLILELFI